MVAHMRYLYWGDQARKEGKENIGILFEAIAYAERIHANNHFTVLKDDMGDETVTAKEPLVKLIDVFKKDTKEEVDLASLMQVMTKIDQIENPNVVKVVVDQNNFAMYFSRSPIPYPRDREAGGKYFEHIGVYAFRKRALDDFTKLDMCANEATEKIEAIRF